MEKVLWEAIRFAVFLVLCGALAEFRFSRREGHGLGLRSARAVAEKYHGLASCQWADGEFRFRAALFLREDPAETPQAGPRKRRTLRQGAAAAATGVLALLLAVSAMPQLADALDETRGAEPAAGAADGQSYGWGDTVFTETLPDPPEADAEAVEAAEENFLAEMEETFRWYAARRYGGYVAMDVTREVLRDDEQYLVVRFDGVLNVGGSVQYSRCLTLDRESGRILALADLFQEGADYITPISQEILAQMTEQVEAGLADYFIPGGIWSEEECFRQIDADQNFYLDPAGDLVILFEEYEVAPGSMGTPSFTIPREVLADILLPPAGTAS